MDELVQICVLALTAAIGCLVIRDRTPVMSGLVSLSACVLILTVSIGLLEPAVRLLNNLRELTGLSDGVTAPLYKAVAIAALTQVSGAVCEDAGEKTLSKSVEIGGTVLTVSVCVPLLSAVLEVMRTILEETG